LVIIILAIVFTVTGPRISHQSDSEAVQEPAPSHPSISSAGVSEEPAVSPPTYRVAHQDCAYPIPLVVSVGTSDEAIKSLLWEIRGTIRSHAYHDLGLHMCDNYGRAGMIEVFRGAKCASETYGENAPCGEGDHDAGSYQWGLGTSDNNNDQDAGYVYSQDKDRTEHLVFDARNAVTMPGNIRSLLDQKAQLRKLNQQVQMKIMNDASEDTPLGIHFFASPDDDNGLWVRATIFSEESNKNAFLSVAIPSLKPSLCKAGFATVTVMSNSLFSSGDTYSLGC
jgi:hypothetical protein